MDHLNTQLGSKMTPEAAKAWQTLFATLVDVIDGEQKRIKKEEFKR